LKIGSFVLGIALAFASSVVAADPSGSSPTEAWPHPLQLGRARALVYQLQISEWHANRVSVRAAIALTPNGAAQTFGTVFVTARTQIDKTRRVVTFDDVNVTRVNFPMLPHNGDGYRDDLQAQIRAELKTLSLDRFEAALAADPAVKPAPVAVSNVPPNIIVSNTPAILVPIDGTPVLRAIPGSDAFQRVINTRALIVQDEELMSYYIHVYDGWLVSDSIAGPWTLPQDPIGGLDAIATQFVQSGLDLLWGPKIDEATPSLKSGVPTIYTKQVPTELIVFKGDAHFVPVPHTDLEWAINTRSDVLRDAKSKRIYALLTGRWFSADVFTGPWTFVASDALPADFKRIPLDTAASVVLTQVAGTPQAREALIANSIPQTAAVPRADGPTFTPQIDGIPVFAPIAGTTLQSVQNASVPIVQTADGAFFAVSAGVWFTATDSGGPWTVATSVPDAVYTIPPQSPLHYATYVEVYESTPEVVYEGYTPGYLGTVVEPGGTIVYGTGYAYSPWIGNTWFAPPWTYGLAAAPVYDPAIGLTYGFAPFGLDAYAWDYTGVPYYGYACCAVASANVYGANYAGQRNWYEGPGYAGTDASGRYVNPVNGTQGEYASERNYDAYTGSATARYSRNFATQNGAQGDVSRGTNYNVYSGQRSYASSAAATGAGGSSIERSVDATGGREGSSRQADTTTYNAHTGETHSWQNDGDDHYAGADGNVYRHVGDGWQRYDDGDWKSSPDAESWADGARSARAAGGDLSQRFSDFGGADRLGGIADRSGGFADRAGGFGGRFGGAGARR
jgi:hypothetical protein